MSEISAMCRGFNRFVKHLVILCLLCDFLCLNVATSVTADDNDGVADDADYVEISYKELYERQKNEFVNALGYDEQPNIDEQEEDESTSKKERKFKCNACTARKHTHTHTHERTHTHTPT